MEDETDRVVTYSSRPGGGEIRATLRTNCGVPTSTSVVFEMFTHRDGCSIMSIPTENLDRFRHFLEIVLRDVEWVIEDYQRTK